MVTGVFVIILSLVFATGLAGGAQRHALGIGVSNPLVALSQIGTWLPFQGNLLLFPIMALCSIAILVYFLRDARDGFHPFKTLIAPILAALSIAFAVYLMISNRAALTTGQNTGWVFASPFIALGVFIFGLLVGVSYKRWSKARYDAIGKFVHDEA